MSQSKKASFMEAVTNTAVGFVITLLFQMWLFPLYDIHTTFSQDVQIVLWFTVLSIARGYVLRRAFNAEFWRFRVKRAH